MQTISRRTAVALAPSLAALPLATAHATQADPVLALLPKLEAARAEVGRKRAIMRTSEEVAAHAKWEEALDREWDVMKEIAGTRPTTVAGAFAQLDMLQNDLLDRLGGQIEADSEWSDMLANAVAVLKSKT